MFIELLLENWLLYLTIIVVVIVSVCLHEFAHALAAQSQGDTTAKNAGYLTLNPWVQMGPYSLLFLFFAGIAWGVTPTKPSYFRFGKLSETLVAFSGPLMNILLMFLCIAGLVLMPDESILRQDWLAIVLKVGAQLNAVLFLLNILPIPPLDGFAMLSPWLPFLKNNEAKLSQYGFFILILLFFVLRLGEWLFDAASDINRWAYGLLSNGLAI